MSEESTKLGTLMMQFLKSRNDLNKLQAIKNSLFLLTSKDKEKFIDQMTSFLAFYLKH